MQILIYDNGMVYYIDDSKIYVPYFEGENN